MLLNCIFEDGDGGACSVTGCNMYENTSLNGIDGAVQEEERLILHCCRCKCRDNPDLMDSVLTRNPCRNDFWLIEGKKIVPWNFDVDFGLKFGQRNYKLITGSFRPEIQVEILFLTWKCVINGRIFDSKSTRNSSRIQIEFFTDSKLTSKSDWNLFNRKWEIFEKILTINRRPKFHYLQKLFISQPIFDLKSTSSSYSGRIPVDLIQNQFQN